MPTPDYGLVWSVLHSRGRAASIHRAISVAWIDYQQYEQRALWRRLSTRRAVVWEHAVDRLIEDATDDPGALVAHHHDTVSFVYDQLVLVRLKKANIQLITSNVQTGIAKNFHAHATDLFGFEGLHRVEAAYVLNEFETRQEWIGIVARERKRVLWQFELAAEAGIYETPMPLFDSHSPDSAGDRIVQHKTIVDAAKKKDRGDSDARE